MSLSDDAAKAIESALEGHGLLGARIQEFRLFALAAVLPDGRTIAQALDGLAAAEEFIQWARPVCEYVSIGKGGVGHQDRPYPDASARRALGVLGDRETA